MEDHPNWQRYIDNQLTEAERISLTEKLQHTDDEMLAEQLLQGWPEADVPPMPKALAMQLDNSLQYLLPPQKRNYRPLLWWAAAAILIGILIHNIYPPAKLSPVVPPARELVNNSSHVRKITLPDNTQLWITPGTHVVIDPAFDEKNRIVSLAGEGYFEVSPGSHPFIVNTGRITTTVLGTHFNVEAYPKEKNISISLTAGKVAVHGADSTLQLKPGTRLIYRKASDEFVTRKFAVENESNWKRGALVLDDLPLETAFSRLEGRYGTTFRYTPGAFNGARFTGVYEAAPLEVVLRNMAFIHGFQYKIRKDTIYIQQYH
ncbi:FecR domain-containing protein [Chitinophaga sp. Cy-1792]|uniref:FecR domain-containing protein n=1 Tax=Chitinophaga sp. Cy-1792 TaxID=2608339 RepID=UPI0014232D8E|nr:FecR domain-containing protein [Chitinophaga sp. Cy-1792]NIG55363.1 DUF4974 domain-containing protein [Chitinophaga sp. Cy-1792]